MKKTFKRIKIDINDACSKCIFCETRSCGDDDFQKLFPCKDNKGNYYFWKKEKRRKGE